MIWILKIDGLIDNLWCQYEVEKRKHNTYAKSYFRTAAISLSCEWLTSPGHHISRQVVIIFYPSNFCKYSIFLFHFNML